MKIVIEAGQHQWYATAEDCKGLYRGLLVVGPSMDSVIDKLPDAFRDLREAAAKHAEPGYCSCGRHASDQCDFCKRHSDGASLVSRPHLSTPEKIHD